ncbi:MAG: hypothetical protein AABZ12_03975 [Planctomycetota bacterium]
MPYESQPPTTGDRDHLGPASVAGRGDQAAGTRLRVRTVPPSQVSDEQILAWLDDAEADDPAR